MNSLDTFLEVESKKDGPKTNASPRRRLKRDATRRCSPWIKSVLHYDERSIRLVWILAIERRSPFFYMDIEVIS